MATSTPWGTSQHKEVICRGISAHSTSGHGGILVSKRLAEKRLSVAALKRAIQYGGYYCFEEDCAIYIAMLELPEILETYTTTKEKVIESLSCWYADYLIERGITPDPEGFKRYQQWKTDKQMRADKHPNLIVSASGSWKTKREDVVEVTTADDKIHFVTTESYSNRSGLNLLSNCVIVEN